MKWLAKDGEPMTRYHALDPRTVERQYSKDEDGRSVEDQAGKDGSLLETYRTLIALRRSSVALRRGRYEPVPCTNPGVWRFRRVHEQQTMEVAINVSGHEIAAGDESGLPYTLPAYGYAAVDITPKGK
jgi:glycosidase